MILQHNGHILKHNNTIFDYSTYASDDYLHDNAINIDARFYSENVLKIFDNNPDTFYQFNENNYVTFQTATPVIFGRIGASIAWAGVGGSLYFRDNNDNILGVINIPDRNDEYIPYYTNIYMPVPMSSFKLTIDAVSTEYTFGFVFSFTAYLKTT